MQKLVADFINEYGLQSDIETRYIDLISEVGELGKEILKSTNYGKQDFCTNEKIANELGDCFFSLFALCHELKIDSKEALNNALLKYKTRFLQKGEVGSGE